MAPKAGETVSPRELADQLEAMARQLRDGRFITESGSWPVPAALKAKIKGQWPEAMAVYRDHVKNMKRAVDDARLAEFQHEVRGIRSAMTACHRAFK